MPETDTGDLKVGRRGIKAPLHEVPMWALHGVARVFEYGGKKYAPGNWIKASDEERVDLALEDYLSAALRHWSAIQGGGDWGALDDESGLPHVDHLLCSLIMLRGIASRAGMVVQDPGSAPGPSDMLVSITLCNGCGVGVDGEILHAEGGEWLCGPCLVSRVGEEAWSRAVNDLRSGEEETPCREQEIKSEFAPGHWLCAVCGDQTPISRGNMCEPCATKEQK